MARKKGRTIHLQELDGNPELLSGWKQIAKVVGVKDGRTIKKWHEEQGLPLLFFGTTPVISKTILKKWLYNLHMVMASKIDVVFGTKRIYFIQAQNGLIKIGTTGDIKSRMRDIKYMSPIKIKLLKTVIGTENEEKIIHEKFAKFRHHGEWFYPKPELLEFIEKIERIGKAELSFLCSKM